MAKSSSKVRPLIKEEWDNEKYAVLFNIVEVEDVDEEGTPCVQGIPQRENLSQAEVHSGLRKLSRGGVVMIRNLWDKFVSLLYKVGEDKWFHFIAGMIATAFVALVPNWGFCVWAAIVVGAAKEGFDYLTTKEIDWWDFACTCFGGILIQLFAL